MNIYEALIGGTAPDEAQTAAIAARLRGQDDQAALAMLSGDKVLTPFGQNMQKRTQLQSMGLAKARKALEDRASLEKRSQEDRESAERRHMETQARLKEQADAQRALTKSYYDQMAKQHEEDLALRERGQDLTLEAATLRAKLAAEKEARAANQKTEDRVTKLGTKMIDEGIPQTKAAFEDVDQYMSKYVDPQTQTLRPGVTDLPGFGLVDNFRPDYDPTLSSEAKSFRAAMQRLANKFIKSEAGTAVSGSEMERQIRALGAGKGMTEQQTIEAYYAMKEATEKYEQGILGAYTPDEQKIYQNRFSPRNANAPGEMLPGDVASMGGVTKSGSKWKVVE